MSIFSLFIHHQRMVRHDLVVLAFTNGLELAKKKADVSWPAPTTRLVANRLARTATIARSPPRTPI